MILNFILVAIIVTAAGFALYTFINKAKKEKSLPKPAPITQQSPSESTSSTEKTPQENPPAASPQNQTNTQNNNSEQISNNKQPSKQRETTPMSGPEIPGPFPY